jgi:hypothetical protein
VDGPNECWPELPYDGFAPTARLLHRGLQALGKLALLKPFERQWAHVVLLPTARGLTTGPVPWRDLTFTVEADMVAHAVRVSASNGRSAAFALGPMSVADWSASLNAALDGVGVGHRVNPVPQEVADPIPFPDDDERRPYDRRLVEAWWRALMASYRIFQVHHGRFLGRTPPIGLMWGTFDLRDARYNGDPCDVTGQGYISRNSANESHVMAGWWPGSEAYPRPAYFSYTYPAPDGLPEAAVRPEASRWEASLGEFVLDYDDVRLAADPGAELLAFLESSYGAGAALAGWQDYRCPGVPDGSAEGASL